MASNIPRLASLRISIFGVQSQGTEVTEMRVIHRDKEWELEGRMTVRQVVEKVGLIPETVLAVRDGKLLTEDTMLGPDDEVRLVAVISGG
jgi:sulfur carrier protein